MQGFQSRGAERQGFEPWIGVAYTRFPSVRLQPLGHLSLDLQHDANSGRKYRRTASLSQRLSPDKRLLIPVPRAGKLMICCCNTTNGVQ